MAKPDVRLQELEEQIRQKFQFHGNFRLMMVDEDGDFITIADDEDLKMAMRPCEAAAINEKSDMGKMALWVRTLA